MKNYLVAGIIGLAGLVNGYAKPLDLGPVDSHCMQMQKKLSGRFAPIDYESLAMSATMLPETSRPVWYKSPFESKELTPSRIRQVHRDVWQNGGVCRHAAVAITDIAESQGLENKIMFFKAANEDSTHVIPLVKEDNKWVAVETTRVGDIYFSKTRSSDTVPLDPNWYENIVFRGQRDFVDEIPMELDVARFNLLVLPELNEIYPGWTKWK